MAKDILERAKKLFFRKRYGDVISLLEPVALDFDSSTYKNSFNFYFILALSCLYTGDTGGASSYFDRARKIRMRDADLMVGQAAVYLRQGKTAEACSYYLDALRQEPSHPKAKKALNFLRWADDEDVSRLIESGKIVRFYPVLKKSSPPVFLGVLTAFLLLVAAGSFFIGKSNRVYSERADLSSFTLTLEEKKNPTETGGSYSYILTSRQILDSYESIKSYFNQYRDNAAQVEINRLLNSNASASVRKKVMMLMDYLSEPGFDTIKDNYSYSQVRAEPVLYLNCWVVWKGMATNIVRTDNSTDFNFLVGYDRNSDLEGVVRVHFPRALSFDQEQPFELLGQIKKSGGSVFINGNSIFQTVHPEIGSQGNKTQGNLPAETE